MNLVVGLGALFIGFAALTMRFVIPPPKPTGADPYAGRAFHRGWFVPLVFGVVPVLAGIVFLAAWWREHDHGGPRIAVQAPAYAAPAARD